MSAIYPGEPGPSNLSYTLRRRYVDRFLHAQVVSLAPGTLLLDLGGHKRDQRGRFSLDRYPVRVICANISPQKGADVLADALHLPFGPGSFQAVICSEVLEHVYHPKRVLRQIYRVLEPGGVTLLTVPFLYRQHGDPQDFGRYTRTYWETALAETGFARFQIEPQGDYLAVVTDFIKQYVDSSWRTPFRQVAALPLGWLARRALRGKPGAGAPDRRFQESFTTGFGIRAEKG